MTKKYRFCRLQTLPLQQYEPSVPAATPGGGGPAPRLHPAGRPSRACGYSGACPVLEPAPPRPWDTHGRRPLSAKCSAVRSMGGKVSCSANGIRSQTRAALLGGTRPSHAGRRRSPVSRPGSREPRRRPARLPSRSRVPGAGGGEARWSRGFCVRAAGRFRPGTSLKPARLSPSHLSANAAAHA